MRALVVDDSRAMRTILKRALASQGFDSIEEASHGQEAMDVLNAQGSFDLALVDWNMPVMTGYELIQEVRGRRDFDSMSIMMVTTETESDQVQKALDAGANEYVMKPFTPEILQDKLLMLGLGG